MQRALKRQGAAKRSSSRLPGEAPPGCPPAVVPIDWKKTGLGLRRGPSCVRILATIRASYAQFSDKATAVS